MPLNACGGESGRNAGVEKKINKKLPTEHCMRYKNNVSAERQSNEPARAADRSHLSLPLSCQTGLLARLLPADIMPNTNVCATDSEGGFRSEMEILRRVPPLDVLSAGFLLNEPRSFIWLRYRAMSGQRFRSPSQSLRSPFLPPDPFAFSFLGDGESEERRSVVVPGNNSK